MRRLEKPKVGIGFRFALRVFHSDISHSRSFDPISVDTRPCKMATPLFPIPAGAVADVSIVDTTSRIRGIAADYLMEPAVEGFDTMPEIPAWSFLVESPGGKKALFDLGVPKDWRSFSPEIQKHLETSGWEVEVTKDTADILTEHGRDLHEVGSIIWR
jgi:hypothetical protein